MKKELFDELTQSIRQAGEIRKNNIEPSRTFAYPPIEVKRIRDKLKVSQSKFAEILGISVCTLQNWEQGRRQPRGAARTLLKVVDRNPQAVLDLPAF